MPETACAAPNAFPPGDWGGTAERRGGAERRSTVWACVSNAAYVGCLPRGSGPRPMPRGMADVSVSPHERLDETDDSADDDTLPSDLKRAPSVLVLSSGKHL